MANPPAKAASRWGSFLQQAVAGLESNLDNILSGDDVPQSAPAPAPVVKATAAVKADSAVPSRSSSANPSTNDRLQERLAKAIAAKKYASQQPDSHALSSNVPSRTGSPVPLGGTPRGSLDVASVKSDDTSDTGLRSPKLENVENAVPKETSGLGITLDETSVQKDSIDLKSGFDAEKASRQSMESTSSSAPRPSLDTAQLKVDTDLLYPEAANNETPSSPTVVDTISQQTKSELEALDLQRQEEIHGYIERIDALQAKLQYLARESAEAARKATLAAPAGSIEKKVAEKDEQIALLMEEGQKLSKTELKHMTTIKKLVAQKSDSEREASEALKRIEKVDKEKAVIMERLRRVEGIERQSNEKQRMVTQLQKETETLRTERDARNAEIANLKIKLAESASQAKAEEVKIIQDLLDQEKKRNSDLDNDVSSLKIEKELVTTKAKVQIDELRAKMEREAERARIAEVEMRGEQQMLESRLEIMRARAEEVSTGATGDAQAKLLRQIETLHTQYAIASENWQGIEASLNARATNLEKERDEALKRETDIRRKAREVTLKAKRNEDEIEDARTKAADALQELTAFKEQLSKLQSRAETAESTLQEAKKAFDQEKLSWQGELQQRLDEERTKWREDVMGHSSYGRAESPVTSSYRGLTAEYLGLQNLQTRRASSRSVANDLPGLERRISRPSSAQPLRSSGQATPQRQDSFNTNGDTLEAPSITTMDHDDYFDHIMSPSSPHRTLNDMISVSTVGAGPSVQLVERMSAAVRRLETEKVSTKEELARLSAQRDEARAEIVALMQEVEAKRSDHNKVVELEEEVKKINARYQTTLEMLGEKSELVEELKADVEDVKAMYRELVERTVK